MTQQSRLLEWADKNSHINDYGSKAYSPFICYTMNMFDERARKQCECEWVPPYGFVIEAGCKEHD